MAGRASERGSPWLSTTRIWPSAIAFYAGAFGAKALVNDDPPVVEAFVRKQRRQRQPFDNAQPTLEAGIWARRQRARDLELLHDIQRP